MISWVPPRLDTTPAFSRLNAHEGANSDNVITSDGHWNTLSFRLEGVLQMAFTGTTNSTVKDKGPYPYHSAGVLLLEGPACIFVGGTAMYLSATIMTTENIHRDSSVLEHSDLRIEWPSSSWRLGSHPQQRVQVPWAVRRRTL
jgi:hypothetical protein